MLAYIGIGAAILVVLLALMIATRPDSFRVARSIGISAAPDVPFGFVNDFHRWTEWSPFENIDPNLKRTYAGSPAGEGARYAWQGNNKVGSGSMTITESIPAGRVVLDLFFEKPFKATNLTTFTFTPSPEGVTVEWAMSGKNTTMGKAMSLAMNMDSYLGKTFDEGLAKLKRVSEA
ncbi:MAG: hypothetical protein JWM95_2870 [Gemmatimonadetes bacterium]|nr:hypothetical protein [Gemmatimonadota bacterium]